MRYPGGQWRPLGPQTQGRMGAHDVICLHTMVGSLDGTDRYFRDAGYGGTESHFGTGPTGAIYQWQDCDYTADANLDGRPYVLSIENADVGPPWPAWNTNDGGAVPAFTDQQIEANAQIIAWLSRPETHGGCPAGWACHRGIPLTLIPNTRREHRGIGYHAQGVPGNGLVSGGVQWSNAVGKVCPGRRRIAQVPQIIDRARQIVGGGGRPPQPQEVDVSPEEHQMLVDIRAGLQSLPQTIASVLRTEGISGVGGQVASVLRSEGVSGAGDPRLVKGALRDEHVSGAADVAAKGTAEIKQMLTEQNRPPA